MMVETPSASNEFGMAIALSTIAGLSTCIGGLGVLFVVHPMDNGIIAMGLGVAASAMCTVSIVDLCLGAAVEVGVWSALISTLLGAAVFRTCQLIIPIFLKNSSSGSSTKMMEFPANHCNNSASRRLWRLALINCFTLTLHNFPEGMAVAVSTISSQALGVKMAFALALHNIPEGLCIAVPAYASGEHSKYVAMMMTFFSGMSEPVGAFITLFVFRSVLSQERIQYALSFVGGIMLCVALTELLPEAMKQERHNFLASGLVLGTFLMSMSLFMLS